MSNFHNVASTEQAVHDAFNEDREYDVNERYSFCTHHGQFFVKDYQEERVTVDYPTLDMMARCFDTGTMEWENYYWPQNS